MVTNLTQAHESFFAIDYVVEKAQAGSIDDPEFFITVGDNIYPLVGDAPTVDEFTQMVQLFNKTNIADKPVWAIRGNHDAVFNWTYELLLTMEQSQWMLPSFYYTKMVPSGKNGELLGLLFVDSVLMLCSNYTAQNFLINPPTDPEIINLRATVCTDPM